MGGGRDVRGGSLRRVCGFARRPAEKQVVATRPGASCEQVEARRRLAEDMPQLALALRNIDVANFSGDSAPQCNERQIVYWGAPPAISDEDRPMVGVKLYFLGQQPGSDELKAGSPDAEEELDDGTQAALFTSLRTAATRFLVGSTVVTVTAGCTNQQAADLTPQPCTGRERGRALLRARSLDAANALQPELERVLGRRAPCARSASSAR